MALEIRCRLCNRVRRLFPDNLCSRCYYSQHSNTFDQRMPMMDVILFFDKLKEDNEDLKTCIECKRELPATRKYFYSNGGKYLKPRCKECYT